MERSVRVWISLQPLLIFLLALNVMCLNQDKTLPSSLSIRSLLGAEKKTQIPDCSDITYQSLCSQHPNCRWCQSHDLDDTCFSKSEAWRLPSQMVMDLRFLTVF